MPLPKVHKIFGTRAPATYKEFFQVVWKQWAEKKSRRIDTSNLMSLELWIKLVMENLHWH